MILNLSQKINNFDNMPLKHVDDKGISVDLTLRTIVIEALLKPDVSDGRLNEEQKLTRFELARRVHNSDEEVEMSEIEIDMVMEGLLKKNFPVLVSGVVKEMLEAAR